jgi:hypothetical protein
MRRVLPAKSLAWWAVTVCAVAAVAIFLAFEVLDLDGSDFARRLFQPLIPSQPTLAEAEEGMRHAAFDVSGGGGLPPAQRPSPVLPGARRSVDHRASPLRSAPSSRPPSGAPSPGRVRSP